MSINISHLNRKINDSDQHNYSFAYLHPSWKKEWRNFIAGLESEYFYLSFKEASTRLISEQNYRDRRNYTSCMNWIKEVNIGDICYIDFGKTFINEAGYQHFGLVFTKYNGKILVIPMTSNASAYAQAYDEEDNPNGKKHLMRIGKTEGLVKKSALFLNDAKFINSARVIDIKSHIDPQSELFQTIRKRLSECIFEQ